MNRGGHSQDRRVTVIAVGLAVIGVALIAAALAANRQWLDRHFLPSFFLPRSQYKQIQLIVRLGVAGAGVLLVLLAPSAARLLTTRNLRLALSMGIAAILALAAGEFVLSRSIGPSAWLRAEDEPRRQPHPHLGWTLVPSRVGYKTIAGRMIEYAVDPSGYRVRNLNEFVDFEEPSLVFAGESIMFGHIRGPYHAT